MEDVESLEKSTRTFIVLTLDKIKSQIKSRMVLVKHPTYNPYRTPFLDSYRADIYPVCLDYYHELNPFMAMDLDNIGYLNDCKVTTLRDGVVSFADFLLKNINKLQDLDTHFLVHPDLARIIPEHLKEKFSCWHHGHTKKMVAQESEKFFIFALAGEELVLDLDKTKLKLLEIKEWMNKKEIILFISNRKNPFQLLWNESVLLHEIIDLIKSIFPENKISYVTIKDVLNMNSWHKIYCLDLFNNTLIHSDNYLNHFIAARGGMINDFNSSPMDDIIFKMPLSLYHEIRLTPLPKFKSIFPEVLFYKKKHPQSELLTDPVFYQLLKNQYLDNLHKT